MDPIAVLQSRIEQLEAKLGINACNIIEGQQGDSATANLLNTAQAINNATAEHEKLKEARNMANELNNYTDPNLAENVSDNYNILFIKMYKFFLTHVNPIVFSCNKIICTCMK